MKQIAFIFILLCFFIVGCHREDPNPELRDPIYEDLYHNLQAQTQALTDAKKKLASTSADLAATRPRTIDRVDDEVTLEKEKVLYQKLVQDVAYDKIKTERRKIDARRAYKLAFLEDKPWPDPKEYQQYLLSKKLESMASDAHPPAPSSASPSASSSAPPQSK